MNLRVHSLFWRDFVNGTKRLSILVVLIQCISVAYSDFKVETRTLLTKLGYSAPLEEIREETVGDVVSYRVRGMRVGFSKNDGRLLSITDQDLSVWRTKNRPDQRNHFDSDLEWSEHAQRVIQNLWPGVETGVRRVKKTGEVRVASGLWASNSNQVAIDLSHTKADGRTIAFALVFDRGTGRLLNFVRTELRNGQCGFHR